MEEGGGWVVVPLLLSRLIFGGGDPRRYEGSSSCSGWGYRSRSLLDVEKCDCTAVVCLGGEVPVFVVGDSLSGGDAMSSGL